VPNVGDPTDESCRSDRLTVQFGDVTGKAYENSKLVYQLFTAQYSKQNVKVPQKNAS